MNASPLPPIPPPPPADAVSETALAQTLGIHREELRKMRGALSEGLHWVGGQGRPVLLTQEGIAEIEALLKAQKKEGGGVDVGAAAQDASQDALYEPMTVVKVAGPRVLLVRPEGSSQEMLRLQVRTSALFMPGMRLEKCRRSHQHAGVAFYHGRYPRRKGHL